MYPFFRILGTAPSPGRQDAKCAGRPALSGRTARATGAVVHGDAQSRQRLPATHLSMRGHMIIRDLFLSDVTRDIPPVVYFHEQSAGEARRRGLRVHHHGRLARGPSEPPPGARAASTSSMCGSSGRSPRSWTSPAGPNCPTPGSQGSTARVSRASPSSSGSRSMASHCPTEARSRRHCFGATRRPSAQELREGLERTAPEDRSARRRIRHRRNRARQRAHPCRGRSAGPEAARLLLAPSRSSPTSSCKLERDGEWERFEETADRVARHALV